MPTYISIGKHTQQGVTNIKDSPKRYEALEKLVQSLDSKIKAAYYTMGQYDFVLIFEAPNNDAAMKILFSAGSGGNIRTETLVATPVERGAKIIEELP